MKDISLVEVNCSRCGSWDAKELIRTPDYELHSDIEFVVSACKGCGHIYTSLRPDYKSLFANFYPENYICYVTDTRNKITDFINRNRMKIQACQRARFIREYNTNRTLRILEVGCGTGEFLRVCRQQFSWEACGIEPSQNLSKILSQEGFRIIPTTLEEADLPKGYFDVVCFFNVLEHLWDPIISLKRINHTLRKGGMVVIEIPSFGSWSRPLFGKYWFLYHLPRHLSHFTRRSLVMAMAECGFEKVSITQQFRPTVNILSLQYAVYNKFHMSFIRQFCSHDNPFMLFPGALLECLQYLTNNANTILSIFRKTGENFGAYVSLTQERQFKYVRPI